MSVRKELKTLLLREDMQLQQLAEEMTKITDKTYTLASLSGKLKRGSFSFEEMETAAKILGYEIKFEKIKSGWVYHEP